MKCDLNHQFGVKNRKFYIVTFEVSVAFAGVNWGHTRWVILVIRTSIKRSRAFVFKIIQQTVEFVDFSVVSSISIVLVEAAASRWCWVFVFWCFVQFVRLQSRSINVIGDDVSDSWENWHSRSYWDSMNVHATLLLCWLDSSSELLSD